MSARQNNIQITNSVQELRVFRKSVRIAEESFGREVIIPRWESKSD